MKITLTRTEATLGPTDGPELSIPREAGNCDRRMKRTTIPSRAPYERFVALTRRMSTRTGGFHTLGADTKAGRACKARGPGAGASSADTSPTGASPLPTLPQLNQVPPLSSIPELWTARRDASQAPRQL